MKLTDTAPPDVALPDFMQEGWLEETLAELDRANLTPEQRAAWEIDIAQKMTIKYAREEEIERAREEVRREVEEVARQERARAQAQMRAEAEKAQEQMRVEAEKAQKETIMKMIQQGYDPSEISEIMNISVESINAIVRGMDGK